jgi:FKBP-type peptidyl-prolyl cis-trans isomerase FklB
MNKVVLSIALLSIQCFSFAQKKSTPVAKKAEVVATATKPQTIVVNAATKPVAKPNGLKNLKDSVSYGLGMNIGRNLKAQKLDKIDALLLYKGLSDILLNKPTVIQDQDANMCIQNYMQKTGAGQQQNAPQNKDPKVMATKAAGKKFMQENAKRQGVVSMPEGYQYEVLVASDSAKPSPTSTVKCHYKGTLIDGTEFDSSIGRGEPFSFSLKGGVIKGWLLAVAKMNLGSKWKVYLPSDLAYGDNAAGEKIPGGSTLIFEIELLGFSN